MDRWQLRIDNYWKFRFHEKIKKKRLTELKEEQYKRSQQYIENNNKQIFQLTETLHSKQEEMSEVERQLYEARKLMLEMENRQIFEKQGTILLLEKDFHNSSIILESIGKMIFNLVQANGKNYIN